MAGHRVAVGAWPPLMLPGVERGVHAYLGIGSGSALTGLGDDVHQRAARRSDQGSAPGPSDTWTMSAARRTANRGRVRQFVLGVLVVLSAVACGPGTAEDDAAEVWDVSQEPRISTVETCDELVEGRLFDREAEAIFADHGEFEASCKVRVLAGDPALEQLGIDADCPEGTTVLVPFVRYHDGWLVERFNISQANSPVPLDGGYQVETHFGDEGSAFDPHWFAGAMREACTTPAVSSRRT